jgi:two-component system response regulator RegA
MESSPGRGPTARLEVVRELIGADRATAVVALTGYGSIATALEATRLGARHYLTNPRRRGFSGSTADRSSGSSPGSPPRADRAQNAFEMPKRIEKRAASCSSFTRW